jgi:hypothetical protein
MEYSSLHAPAPFLDSLKKPIFRAFLAEQLKPKQMLRPQTIVKLALKVFSQPALRQSGAPSGFGQDPVKMAGQTLLHSGTQ